VDAGINVSLPFLSSAPDMGAFELSEGIINLPPSANAGSDRSITLPTSYTTLTGSGSDIGGTITGYQWTKISGPSGASIVNPASATTQVNMLLAGEYQFQLTVTDNSGATATDQVQVTVNPAPNVIPVVNAGADVVITLPSSVVSLAGNASDADGTIASYQWIKISGPAATIANSGSATTAVNDLAEGVYQFQLKVTDNSGATATDEVQVTVYPVPNVSPLVNAGSDIVITLPTSAISLAGNATDADGTIASYQWTKISGPGATIASSGSATTDVTGLVDGVYQFELKVTDDEGAFATDIIQVTVLPAPPNTPPIANAGADVAITLPATSATLAGNATDADGSVTTYQWTQISGPAATIDNAGYATTAVHALTEGAYEFELKVTDNAGATATDIVQVTVFPAQNNKPPTADAGTDLTITLPQSETTLSGSGTDSDGTVAGFLWTQISGPSAAVIVSPADPVTFVSALTEGVFVFQLQVIDNAGATATALAQVTVNSAGTANVEPVANAGDDLIITLPVDSVSLLGSGNDPDGSIVSYQWTKVSGPAVGWDSIPAATAVISALSEGVYVFRLTVTDSLGAVATDDVQVTVNPVITPAIGKVIRVNIYGETTTFDDNRWNNWKPVSNISSALFNYEDGTPSTVTANLSGQSGIHDNGSNYLSNATVCPPGVLRYASSSWSSRVVTISGLDPAKTYSFDFYSSSDNIWGYQTEFTVNRSAEKVNTYNNGNAYAHFSDVAPEADGTIEIGLRSIGIWNYLSGFTITESEPVQSFSRSIGNGQVSATTATPKTGAAKVQELPEIMKVNAYPLPFTTSVTVSLQGGSTGKHSMSLLNVSGSVVWKKEVNKTGISMVEHIHVGNLPAGMYILVIIGPDSKTTKQLIKN
jgi:ribosomal protein L14